MTTRRNFVALAGAAALAGGFGGSAQAQGATGGWPSRSVRVISPTATGGPGQNFRFFADMARHRLTGETYPVDGTFLNYTVRRPVGVAGLITPWNTPFMLSPGNWRPVWRRGTPAC